MALVWNPWVVGNLASGLFLIVAAALIYAARPWRLQNRALAVAFFVFAWVDLGLALMWSTTDAWVSWAAKGLWTTMMAVFPFPYLIFLSTFDSPLSRPLSGVWARRVLAGLGVAVCVGILPFLHLFSGPMFHPWFAPWYPAPREDTLGRLILANGLVFFYGLAVMATAMRRAPPGTASRSRLAGLTTAMVIRDAPFAILMVAYSSLRFTGKLGDIIYVIAVTPAVDLVFAAALVIAVLRHDVLGLRMRRAPSGGADGQRRRLQAYRAILEVSEDVGLSDPRERAMLKKVRRDLKISQSAHDGVLAEVRGTRTRFAAERNGRFRVERELGAGGEGRAWLARDLVLGRDVVLKAPNQSGRSRAEILREARAAARVQHPNVVAIHEALAEQDPLVLVLEHVPGGTLEGRLESGPLSDAQAFAMVDGLLEGTAALHDADLVHGDIKPSNIFLTETGDVKLGDLGRATRAGRAPAGGTPGYTAPETVRGDYCDARSDVWSIGAVLHAMVTGAPAPPGATRNVRLPGAALRRRPKAQRSPILDVALRAMEANPESRYASVRAMQQAVRGLSGQTY